MLSVTRRSCLVHYIRGVSHLVNGSILADTDLRNSIKATFLVCRPYVIVQQLSC